MTDSMGPGKLVRHMQNPLYTYDEYFICTGLGPSIWSAICKKSVVQWSVISKFTCIYIYTYIQTYIHTYIHKYIQTYIHTQKCCPEPKPQHSFNHFVNLSLDPKH